MLDGDQQFSKKNCKRNQTRGGSAWHTSRGHKVEKEAESEVPAFVVSVGWFGFLG